MRANQRTVRTARHLFRLCQPGGKLDESRVRLIARHLGASKQRHGLAILSAFERLVRLDRDRHTALVESAVPLSEDVRNEVRASLARVYGPGLDASFTDHPPLIGGMRIRVGSDVYDGSVRARLAALEARL
jgi:F-type H+-transporting ATPase subunit delta